MTASLRLGVLVVAIAVAACRPEIEQEIPCAVNGDLSCPTGWHCGHEGRCVPGEAAPTLCFIAPTGAPVHAGAYLDVEFAASSPRGLASGTLAIESSRGRFEAPLTTEMASDGVRATYRARVETWRAGPGPATLVAQVMPKQAPRQPAELRLDVQVALDFQIAFTEPADDAAVRGQVPVRARVTNEVPLANCEFRSETRSMRPSASADEEGIELTAKLDLSHSSDGPTELIVECTDALGRTEKATKGVVVENTLLSLQLEPLKPVSGKEPGILEVIANKPIPEPPLVTFANGDELLSTAAPDGVTATSYQYKLTATPGADGEETVMVRARDRFGDEVFESVTVKVDARGPTGSAIEHRELTFTRVELTCHENAEFRIEPVVLGPPATGLCGSSPVFRTLSSNVARIVLIDALGNENAFVPQTLIEELAPQGASALLPVTTKFDPMQALSRPEHLDVLTGFREIDGSGATAPNIDAPSVTGMMQPLGQLRESVPVSQAVEVGDRIVFLSPDGPYHHWWEIDRDGRTRLLWPYAKLGDGVLEPMLDPRDGSVLASENGHLVSIGLHGQVTPLRQIANLGDVKLRGRVCGEHLYATTTTAPFWLMVARLGETTTVLPESLQMLQAIRLVHFVCDGDQAALIVGVEDDEFGRVFVKRDGVWTLTPQPLTLRTHEDGIVGGSFYGGGRWRDQMDIRHELLEFRDGAFSLVGAAPAFMRETAAALRRSDGTAVIIGGRHSHESAPLLVTEKSGYLEPALPGPPRTGVFDATNDRFIGIKSESNGNAWSTELREWSPDDGWTIAATLPPDANGGIVWEPVTAKTYVIPATAQQSEYVYDASSGALTTRPPSIHGSFVRGAPLSNARVALWSDWGPNGWSTAVYDVQTQEVVREQVPAFESGVPLVRPDTGDVALLRRELNDGLDHVSIRLAREVYSGGPLLIEPKQRFVRQGVLVLPGWAPTTFVTNQAIRHVASQRAPIPAHLPTMRSISYVEPHQDEMGATDVPGRWAQRLWLPHQSPSFWEWSEHAAGAYWVEVPPGDVRIEICARDDTDGSESRAKAWIATGGKFEVLTGIAGPGCVRYSYQRNATDTAALVVASNGEPGRTLLVDQLRIHRTTRR